MQEAVVSPLIAWENFYVIIGSSAAALTGLMFVAITLTAGNRVGRLGEAFASFGTPTVVHFCVAFFIAAVLSAPWQELWNVGLVLGLCGLWGVAYVIIVLRRTRRQTDYKPVLEDWVWHVILPFVCYATLVAAAIILLVNPILALFGIGVAAVLLLFIGIHNAWDTVTYITIEYFRPESESQD